MAPQISDTDLGELQRIQHLLTTTGTGRDDALAQARTGIDTLRANGLGEHPSVLLVQTQVAHASGDREATILAARALSSHTTSTSALTAAVRALLASGAHHDAGEVAEAAIPHASTPATLHALALEGFSRSEGESQRGILHLEALLPHIDTLTDRQRASAHLAAARIGVTSGEHDAARSHLAWVRELTPEHPSLPILERTLAASESTPATPATSVPAESAQDETGSAEAGRAESTPATSPDPATPTSPAGAGTPETPAADDVIEASGATPAEPSKSRRRREKRTRRTPATEHIAAETAAAETAAASERARERQSVPEREILDDEEFIETPAHAPRGSWYGASLILAAGIAAAGTVTLDILGLTGRPALTPAALHSAVLARSAGAWGSLLVGVLISLLLAQTLRGGRGARILLAGCGVGATLAGGAAAAIGVRAGADRSLITCGAAVIIHGSTLLAMSLGQWPTHEERRHARRSGTGVRAPWLITAMVLLGTTLTLAAGLAYADTRTTHTIEHTYHQLHG